MTSDLRDRLDDLLDGVPAHVHADSGTAWRAGARRRVRRRVASGGAIVAVLALVGGVGVAVHRAAEPQPAGRGSIRSAASSYPTRIDAPLLRTGTLPECPGPVAGLIQRDDGWYAVGQAGQIWRIPGATARTDLASISPDGSRIASLGRASDGLKLSLRDLDSGVVSTLAIGDFGPRHPGLPARGQTFWSPDSHSLLVPVRQGQVVNGPDVRALLATPGEATQVVTAPRGRHVEPIGWLSSSTLGWLVWDRDDLHPSVVTTGPRGGKALSSHRAPGRIPRNQYVSASLMPSVSGAPPMSVTTAARQLLISNAGRSRSDSGVVGSRPLAVRRQASCPASWTDSYPVLPATGPGDHLLWTGPGSYVVQVDPALGPVHCSVWSYDALRGHAHAGLGGALFGERTDWLSWHWRQVGLGAAAVLVLLVGLAGTGLHRRRTRRTA
jgi:hypothetical protein